MTERTMIVSRFDRFELSALAVQPAQPPIGGVVVAQEIFGLTDHIADICAAFADAGYCAIAPGLFDRIERDFEAGLDAAGIDKGRAAVAASPWPQVTGDMQAAIEALPKPTFVAGFCYGGAVAWMAAAECSGVSAAACFYGRLIAELVDHKPKAPVMLHYGARDASIPPENIEGVRAAAPDAPLYLYDAGHGFCRAGSHDFHADARALAMGRTLDWFARWR